MNHNDMKEARTIKSLRPNVTREDALRTFQAAGPASWYWKLRAGALSRIAEVYVPFRVYRVHYPIGGMTRTQLYAIDAVNGSLDLFAFTAQPGENELVEICTRNSAERTLSERRSEELLREKVLRVIFQQGFFKLRKIEVSVELLPGELHLPYWLGFYGSERLRCRVLDAVRRRVEGAKASALFEEWLAA